MTNTPQFSAAIRTTENAMLARLIPTASSIGMVMESSPYHVVAPGEIPPNRPGVQVPIGNLAGTLSNREGNKFTRGWLSGAGGADIEQNLGANAFDIRPAPYNSRLGANFRAVVPEYGAPVAGLTNWDVEKPGLTWGPLQEARAEWVPTTWSNRLAGEDVISGNFGPRVATAKDGITNAPTPQYYAYAQAREGGDGWASYPFGQRRGKAAVKSAVSAAEKGLGAAGALGGGSMFRGPK